MSADVDPYWVFVDTIESNKLIYVSMCIGYFNHMYIYRKVSEFSFYSKYAINL